MGPGEQCCAQRVEACALLRSQEGALDLTANGLTTQNKKNAQNLAFVGKPAECRVRLGFKLKTSLAGRGSVVKTCNL